MRKVLIALGIVSAVTLVTLAAGWLAFQNIPSWYDPPYVAQVDLPRVRSSLPRAYQGFTDAVVNGRRFEYALSARMVNEWIAARVELWPDARDVVPHWLAEPMVVFDGGRIGLAARFERDDLRAVVSARLTVEVVGDWIEIKIGGFSIGALPVPRDAVIGVLEKPLETLAKDSGRWPDSLGGVAERLEGMDAERLMEEGVRIENRFHWSNGDRDFRLLEIRVEGGELVVTGETF